MRAHGLLAALGVVLAAAACTQVLDFDALGRCANGAKDGDESDVDCGGSCDGCGTHRPCGGPDDCASGVCPTALGRCICPEDMKEIMIAADRGYCVDKLEVTAGDYQSFAAASDIPADDTPECRFNQDLHPGGPAAADPTLPVTGVNWCDARRYCEWAGKRLCGAIQGGDNLYDDFRDPARSQWFRACAGEAAAAFPYGTQYQPQSCNGGDYMSGLEAPIPVGTAPACTQPGSELFDLSGNVAEWEDSCDDATGGEDDCRVRGGSYDDGEPDLACGAGASLTRSSTDAAVGFRCCTD